MTGIEAALVSGILNIVGTKLAPLVTKRFSSIAGVTKDLQDLQDLVEDIKIWLERVGSRALENERSSNWLKRLKEAAYDAEDLVNEFHIKSEKHGANVAGDNSVVIKYLWRKPKSILFECKTAQEIKKIKKRLDEIVKGRSDYSTIANSMPVVHPVQHINKMIGEVALWTIVDETLIFGRDQEKDLVITELTEASLQQKIKIVSVIGLGGSGKTTLAKLVFNDSAIQNHFEAILWVHVSREFSVQKLVEKLFEAITDDKADHLPLQRVSRTISDKLAGKRFLLVMDDVWTEDRIDWEQFAVHLKSGAPGSCILLTTRNRQVAEVVDSACTFDLPLLSEVDSWKLFQQSFGISMEALDPEFRELGKEIVKRCGGMPLAIKSLAGVLCGKKRIEEWQSIRESNLLDAEEKQDNVSACLRLSYFNFPHHLKHCFTHCSILPRGHLIYKRRLIYQWIAHGFVTTNQAQQPEDVGIDYFNFLLKVGFLQDTIQRPYDSDVGYKMHDLVYDLARQILRDELVSEKATSDQIKGCRYLSLTSCTSPVDRKLFNKVHALYVSRGNPAFDKRINKRSCVRTIILERISAASLCLYLSKFELLGYLEISNVKCEVLPEAISHCWNLQAIHMIDCNRLANLPQSIGKLKKLRTLVLDGCWKISTLPQSICGCDDLQSLYVKGSKMEDIPQSIWKIEKLRVLWFCANVLLEQFASVQHFGKICNLQTITLSYCSLQHVPQCITLLTHLEHLDLEGCRELVELPEGIANLKMLQVLNLYRCNKLRGLPAGCAQLTHLHKLGLFVIGESTTHARISELENLDKLNGELQIKNITHVKNPDDAVKANLRKKNGIRKLSLDWHSRSWVEFGDSDTEELVFVELRREEELLLHMEKDLRLLNGLEPPSEIQELRVGGYSGLRLPCWMTKQSDSFDLADMHMLKKSKPLPFSHLTKLVLENLPNLEHLQGLVDLPAIKILELRALPKLDLLTFTADVADGKEEVDLQCHFPSLLELVIGDCSKLNVKTYFPLSLQKLTLEGSNEPLLSLGSFFRCPGDAHEDDESCSSSYITEVKTDPCRLTQLKLGKLIGSSGWEVLQHLTGLRDLEINRCNELRQLPETMRGLTCLHRLSLQKCENLCVLPEWLGELQSLRRLDIFFLPAISNLPPSINRLTLLQDLDIRGCKPLQRLPEEFGELCSLRSLTLWGLPALTCLPESMQRLTSLQFLNWVDCHCQLPESLGELPALRKFWIQNCPTLTSLPHFIQRLPVLEELRIATCPELYKRCQEGVGQDWHLVSHIPDLELDEFD